MVREHKELTRRNVQGQFRVHVPQRHVEFQCVPPRRHLESRNLVTNHQPNVRRASTHSEQFLPTTHQEDFEMALAELVSRHS